MEGALRYRAGMDSLAAGFWGAFFGTATLMLLAALAVFLRSHRRVALTAGLSALVSAAFVIAYLGWLPVGGGAAEARVLAHVAILSAITLALMLLSLLGLLRPTAAGRRLVTGLAALGLGVIVVGWILEPVQSLALSSVVA
ncbi:MAG: putative rane protein, partial [Ramlibacter sp.]|nr:putative rane protein [Ramlibacter sp.]